MWLCGQQLVPSSAHLEYRFRWCFLSFGASWRHIYVDGVLMLDGDHVQSVGTHVQSVLLVQICRLLLSPVEGFGVHMIRV